MPHPVRKTYKPGLPGFLRKETATTLSSIKKTIRTATDKTQARKSFRSLGLLA